MYAFGQLVEPPDRFSEVLSGVPALRNRSASKPCAVRVNRHMFTNHRLSPPNYVGRIHIEFRKFTLLGEPREFLSSAHAFISNLLLTLNVWHSLSPYAERVLSPDPESITPSPPKRVKHFRIMLPFGLTKGSG
jgi:hypothetical protein